VTAGNGGGLGIATGVKATAGAYGNTTVTAGTSAVKGMMSIALTATAGGSPPGQASNPSPANGATSVGVTTDLSWTAGSGATSHDVYFGTAASPPFIQNQTATTYDTGTMANNKTYYWRIDEKNAGGTTTGVVWSFTTVASAGTGTGLTGDYYDNMDFTNLKLTRTDPTINFDWGSGSPDPAIGADTFSVSWAGQVQPLYSETYTFYTTSDDGVRLWVNGQLIIDNWTDHAPTENSGTIALTAGTKYNIDMDYYENGGGAVAKLEWSSTSQSRQVIPQTQLYPVEVTPPAAPTNLTATAGDAQVALSWDASAGADKYNVYRGTGGNYYLQASPTATSWTDTSVSNGTTYWYYVTAENAAGQSSPSNTVSATPQAPTGQLLAYDDLNVSTGALHGKSSGSGWSEAWYVQNTNTTIPGFEVRSASLLSYSNLKKTGNYAVGGREYLTAGHRINVDGAFANYIVPGSSPSVIGKDGTTLWMSVLVRKDADNDDDLTCHLTNGQYAEGYGDLRVAVGFFGANSKTGTTRYWTLKVRNAANSDFDYTKSNVALTVGQTALLVVKMQFGSTDSFSLYVNPSSLGGGEPGTPNATWTTTGATNIVFRTLGWLGGNGPDMGSMDEVRFGNTYSAVTPTQ
jgi:hypothetical protein